MTRLPHLAENGSKVCFSDAKIPLHKRLVHFYCEQCVDCAADGITSITIILSSYRILIVGKVIYIPPVSLFLKRRCFVVLVFMFI